MKRHRKQTLWATIEWVALAIWLTVGGCAAAGDRMPTPDGGLGGSANPPRGLGPDDGGAAGPGDARLTADATTSGIDASTGRRDGAAPMPMEVGTSPVLGQITSGCDAERGDVYAFEASAGQAIRIIADTVSDATKSDLWARLYQTPSDPEGSELVTDDDSLDCTFPVELFGCPEMRHTVESSESGTLYIFVGISSDQCADARLAEFSLSVTADERPVDLSIVSDEVHGVW